MKKLIFLWLATMVAWITIKTIVAKSSTCDDCINEYIDEIKSFRDYLKTIIINFDEKKTI